MSSISSVDLGVHVARIVLPIPAVFGRGDLLRVQIGLHDIPRDGLVLDEDIPAELIMREQDRAAGVVSLELTLEKSALQVHVKGCVSVQFGAECHRCLREIELSVDAGVDAVFQPRPTGTVALDLELDEEALGLTYYDGLELDLGPLLRDSLVVAMPLVLLCAEDCGGLCARCGELKDEGCACPEQPADPGNPFAEFARKHMQ